MTTQITITLDADAKDEDIQMLLRDALAEFTDPRTPVDKYVEKRYREQSDEFRKRKIIETTARVQLAQRMKRAVDRMKVDRFETLEPEHPRVMIPLGAMRSASIELPPDLTQIEADTIVRALRDLQK